MITSTILTRLNEFSLRVNECDFNMKFGKDGMHLYDAFLNYDRDVVKLSQVMTNSQIKTLIKMINQ